MLLRDEDGLFLARVRFSFQGAFLVNSTANRHRAMSLDRHTAESLQAFLADIGYIFYLEDE